MGSFSDVVWVISSVRKCIRGVSYLAMMVTFLLDELRIMGFSFHSIFELYRTVGSRGGSLGGDCFNISLTFCSLYSFIFFSLTFYFISAC